jgi:cytosine/adenosine deaminase-related metal-dependent hydrolase
VTFSLTPETEMLQGHGFPITGRLRKLGAAPSLGVDLESGISGDLFTVARVALATQRAFDNAESRATTGKLPETSTINCREALGWITLEGARMLKMEDRIGSLAPGKQADVILIRADDLNMWPVHDPVTSVVMQAGTGNVDTVMIGGVLRKRHGRLLYPELPQKKEALQASGRRILRELGLLH